MGNRKKVLCIFLFLIFTFILSIPFVIVVQCHLQMTDFKEGTVEEYDSFDGHYTLRLSIDEDDYIKLHYANVSLQDNITGEEVFFIKNEYRAFDFQWVVWENGSHNFWLKSGDLGTFYYEFQSDNEVWIKYGVVKTEKKYYVLRERMGGIVKKIDIEEVRKRLPEGYSLE
ncbi:MAG: hypothetical protein K2P73_09360 [Lachnospiraceae bacterium]|nr:hypothetical protein [Lachnospiraceae bacterium]